MNIYRVELIAAESPEWPSEWFTEAANAVEAVVKMYGDANNDIEPDLKNADELTIAVSLVERNMTMEQFEQNYPEFFFT